MNDLKDSISRLLDNAKIYDNERRYAILVSCIEDLYQSFDNVKKDELRLILFEEGIKRLAGI